MADDLPLDLSDEMQASLRKLDDGEDPSPISREILLELADHLQCAARREQLVEGPAGQVADEQIWKRVLHRFGDPARVAWQLWWDANWEKLMSQRITNILLAVLIVACLGLGFLTWRSMSLYRVAIEQARAEAMRAQAQAEQMLLTLKEQAETSRKAAAPSEWNQVALELRYDSPIGDLVEGASVMIAGISPNTKSIPRQELKSGSDGLADFGQVLFGEYALQIKLPNEAVLVRKIGVRPGKEFRETIVCPRQPTKPVSITIEDLPLPAEFAIPDEVRKRVWYRVTFSRGDRVNAFESLLKADQPRPESGLPLATGPLNVWEGALPPFAEGHRNDFSVFRRPDGSWVYPREPLEAVPELTPESVRFRSWTPEPRSFVKVGDQLAAEAGNPISVPLGKYWIYEVETFLELHQLDGGTCLGELFSWIDHPQPSVGVQVETHPRGISKNCGEFEFAFKQASQELLEIYRERQNKLPDEEFFVDFQRDVANLVLSPFPSASLSLAMRSKLPPGAILSQIVAVVPSTDAELLPERVDLFATIHRSNEETSDESVQMKQVPVFTNMEVFRQSSTQRVYKLIVVGLTFEQLSIASKPQWWGNDAIIHMRPALEHSALPCAGG